MSGRGGAPCAGTAGRKSRSPLIWADAVESAQHRVKNVSAAIGINRVFIVHLFRDWSLSWNPIPAIRCSKVLRTAGDMPLLLAIDCNSLETFARSCSHWLKAIGLISHTADCDLSTVRRRRLTTRTTPV